MVPLTSPEAPVSVLGEWESRAVPTVKNEIMRMQSLSSVSGTEQKKVQAHLITIK